MKIFQYLRFHIKMICQRFRIIALLNFIRYDASEIYEMLVYKHIKTTEYVKKYPTF